VVLTIMVACRGKRVTLRGSSKQKGGAKGKKLKKARKEKRQ